MSVFYFFLYPTKNFDFFFYLTPKYWPNLTFFFLLAIRFRVNRPCRILWWRPWRFAAVAGWNGGRVCRWSPARWCPSPSWRRAGPWRPIRRRNCYKERLSLLPDIQIQFQNSLKSLKVENFDLKTKILTNFNNKNANQVLKMLKTALKLLLKYSETAFFFSFFFKWTC